MATSIPPYRGGIGGGGFNWPPNWLFRQKRWQLAANSQKPLILKLRPCTRPCQAWQRDTRVTKKASAEALALWLYQAFQPSIALVTVSIALRTATGTGWPSNFAATSINCAFSVSRSTGRSPCFPLLRLSALAKPSTIIAAVTFFASNAPLGASY